MGGARQGPLRVGGRIIDRQLALLRQVADPVFVVAATARHFPDVSVEVVPDLIPGAGALGGIDTAIRSSQHARTLVVACDMPFPTLPLLQALAQRDADLVIPRSARGYEPLCAVWSDVCAEPIRRRIDRGEVKAGLEVEDVRGAEIGPDILRSWDPDGLLLMNVNTPHDYARTRRLTR